MKNNKPNSELTPGAIVFGAALSAPVGALCGGITGSLGKLSLSLFSPGIGGFGSFATFAGIGAIAAPLTILPKLLTDYLYNNSAYLKKHPYLKSFLKDTTGMLLSAGAIAAAAAMISSPIGLSVACMMVIPTIFYVLKTLCNVINSFLAPKDNQVLESAPRPVSC